MSKPRQFCIHGHDTHTCGRDSKSMCRCCKSERSKEYTRRYVERHKQTPNKTYRIKNYDRYTYLWRTRSLKKYGLTVEKYEAILAAQGYTCAICGTSEAQAGKTVAFAVDHDHKTGAVRGLLCFRCNLTLGKVEDDVSLLQKMIDYLGGQ